MLSFFLAAPSSVRANSVPVTNVALNADVEIHGGSFFTGGWLPPRQGYPVSIDTIVDGVFLPRENQWNRGPVWWDSRDLVERYITIDLGDIYEIESFVVQTDDNDVYKLYYWDLSTATWTLIWDVPNFNHLGWGMLTRPNSYDNSERHLLTETIITNALKYEGNMNDGDCLFGVSEIQAFGKPVATATIDFDPNTLNLKSKGKWVTVYIELLDGYDILDIDITTIMLNGQVPIGSHPYGIGDYDADSIPDLMVKFDRTAVQNILTKGNAVEIKITGKLYNTMLFIGTDYIRVI